MDFSAVLPTFVITLREGVEAALVVGIVLACLQKAQRGHLTRWVYGGIGLGILVSVLIGVLFSGLIQVMGVLGPAAEPLMEGVFSLVAVVLLSWMLIWMTQQASSMKKMLEGEMASVLAQEQRAGWGVLSLIFVAVLREGFETVVFIAAKFQQGWLPATGAILGIGVAAGIGVLLFKWGIRLNLRRFFTVMGVVLLLLVAGLLVTALGHFDTVVQTLASQNRASELMCFYYERFARVHSCVLGPAVWNLSKILPADKFPGMLLNALFGYTDRLYQVQAVAYGIFLVALGSLYFRSLLRRPVIVSEAKARAVAGRLVDAKDLSHLDQSR
jgi:high-affinity iron transporter